MNALIGFGLLLLGFSLGWIFCALIVIGRSHEGHTRTWRFGDEHSEDDFPHLGA